MKKGYTKQSAKAVIESEPPNIKPLCGGYWRMGAAENAEFPTTSQAVNKMRTANGYQAALDAEPSRHTRAQITPDQVSAKGGYAEAVAAAIKTLLLVLKNGYITSLGSQQIIAVLAGALRSMTLFLHIQGDAPLQGGS